MFEHNLISASSIEFHIFWFSVCLYNTNKCNAPTKTKYKNIYLFHNWNIIINIIIRYCILCASQGKCYHAWLLIDLSIVNIV